jgi:hypothetical protein
MKTVTESSKKGSKSRQVVDENAVGAAKAQLAKLETEIASLENEKDTAKSQEDNALKTKETSKAELDENITQLSTFNEADGLLTKFSDAFSGVCLATRSQCLISMSWAPRSLCLVSENIEEETKIVPKAKAHNNMPPFYILYYIMKL